MSNINNDSTSLQTDADLSADTAHDTSLCSDPYSSTVHETFSINGGFFIAGHEGPCIARDFGSQNKLFWVLRYSLIANEEKGTYFPNFFLSVRYLGKISRSYVQNITLLYKGKNAFLNSRKKIQLILRFFFF